MTSTTTSATTTSRRRIHNTTNINTNDKTRTRRRTMRHNNKNNDSIGLLGGGGRFLFVLLGLCLVLFPSVVLGEKGYFDVYLDPDSSVVHYSEGYLVAPGTIDLTTLSFQAKESIFDISSILASGVLPNDDDVALDQETHYGGRDDDDDFIPAPETPPPPPKEQPEQEPEETTNTTSTPTSETPGDGEVTPPPSEGDNVGGGDNITDSTGDGGNNDSGNNDDDGGRRRWMKRRTLLHRQRYRRTLQSDNNNNNTQAPPQQKQQKEQDEDEEHPSANRGVTQVDIAVVFEPASCANTRSGCDWVDLGIGRKYVRDDDGFEEERWCCAGDAMDLGLCEKGSQYYGQLILNENFQGTHRYVEIPSAAEDDKLGDDNDDDGSSPSSSSQIQTIKWGEIEEYESGNYLVIFANCNDDYGREVLLTGYTTWESKHGYLPGELFHFMYFYFLITVLYTGLFVAYVVAMKQNKESRIDIEKWIFATIAMGFLETTSRSCDFIVWNHTGDQLLVSYYIGVILGVVKRAVSRCLIVMVSLGWGIVRDSLGPSMPKILALGVFYIGVSSIHDVMVTIAVEDIETLSLHEEDELFDVVAVLQFLVAIINVVFTLWILHSLNDTMENLESMGQTRKLQKFLRLRCIFSFSVLFAVLWQIFSLINEYNESAILEEQHEWMVDAATELNYLYVLIAVALLWWPNPLAKEYAFQMELPATGGDEDDHDGENGGFEGYDGDEGGGPNELELTAAKVPSAVDEDDDDDKDKEGSDDISKNFAIIGADDDEFHDDKTNGTTSTFEIS